MTSGAFSRLGTRFVHAKNSARSLLSRRITRSASSVRGSSQSSQCACRPRVRSAATRPASSPSAEPASTIRGWRMSGRANFMRTPCMRMIVTMQAIEVAETGGPEVLSYVERPQPSPGPDEVLIKADAIGVNFIETYFRSGTYPRELPFVPGTEVAGTVASLGDGVTGLSDGDRVATAAASGSYAEFSTAPAQLVAHVPSEVSLDVAASALLKGMTAHYLITSVYPVQPGDAVLVHAGAGGVGLILTQWATNHGVRVITTVSTPAKAELSRQAGATDVLDYPGDDAAEFGGGGRRNNPGGGGGGGGGGVRRRRGQHVRRQLGQPRRAGNPGIVRCIQRTGAARRPSAAQRGRIGLPDPAVVGALHPPWRGIRLALRRSVLRDRRRIAEHHSEPS